MFMILFKSPVGPVVTRTTSILIKWDRVEKVGGWPHCGDTPKRFFHLQFLMCFLSALANLRPFFILHINIWVCMRLQGFKVAMLGRYGWMELDQDFQRRPASDQQETGLCDPVSGVQGEGEPFTPSDCTSCKNLHESCYNSFLHPCWYCLVLTWKMHESRR